MNPSLCLAVLPPNPEEQGPLVSSLVAALGNAKAGDSTATGLGNRFPGAFVENKRDRDLMQKEETRAEIIRWREGWC